MLVSRDAIAAVMLRHRRCSRNCKWREWRTRAAPTAERECQSMSGSVSMSSV